MIKYDFLYVLLAAAFFVSCKPAAKISGSPIPPVSAGALNALQDSLSGAHLGVLITEAETGKLLAELNSHKYFVPASNTKLVSLYAGLKYLPDTLVGLRYLDAGDTVYALPTGDPTLLAEEYSTHPVMEWLSRLEKPLVVDASNWRAAHYGSGWTWNDYQAGYQPERSALPVNGNMVPLVFSAKRDSVLRNGNKVFEVVPKLEYGKAGKGFPIFPVTFRYQPEAKFTQINREYAVNSFEVVYNGRDTLLTDEIPFVTHGLKTGVEILNAKLQSTRISIAEPGTAGKKLSADKSKILLSQPLDSMLRPMMHRSDNFYAEQTVLMASNEFLGYMSERDMIDTLVKTDLKDMPDKPVWADGSGLSRYNLFSPADFIWLLKKMSGEFGMERLKVIMQTGNTGTLTNYYKSLAGKLYAKTGTLSGQVGLSGYLYAKSGKLLLFSVLVNNHNSSATRVRRQVERYLTGVWEEN